MDSEEEGHQRPNDETQKEKGPRQDQRTRKVTGTQRRKGGVRRVRKRRRGKREEGRGGEKRKDETFSHEMRELAEERE